MGEKGNLGDVAAVTAAVSTEGPAAAQRAVNIATSVVTEAGDTLREKLIGTAADHTVAELRGRLQPDEAPSADDGDGGDGGTAPPA
jgi:hypothetical protein